METPSERGRAFVEAARYFLDDPGCTKRAAMTEVLEASNGEITGEYANQQLVAIYGIDFSDAFGAAEADLEELRFGYQQNSEGNQARTRFCIWLPWVGLICF